MAERYDESSSEMFDPAVIEPTVDFLAGLAGDGAALELGIGTGRVALPLSRRGVTVCGIDLSEALLNIGEDSFRVVERGAREFHVTRVKFLPRIVDQAKGHIHVGFNEVHENPVGSVMVRCVCHVVRVQFAVREILYGL